MVSFDGECEGDFWYLCLQDQGFGVVEDQLECIFFFYQCLDDSVGEGFGFGLVIVWCVIELQGGWFWVSNGKFGLCLYFWLLVVV